MIRRSISSLAIALFLLCPCHALADDVFESTWKATDGEAVNFTGKKVAALILSKNRAARAAAEELLADQLTARGAEGIAAGTLVGESDLEDRGKLRSLLQAAGIAGAVVMRPVLAGGRHAGPDMWKDPQYRRFMGFSSEPAPEGEKKVAFFVEVLVYSLEQDKLIWAGKSATKASTIEELLNNMAEGAALQLSKEGLV